VEAQSLTEPWPQKWVRRRVLITGAAGRIGRSFAAYAQARYELRLLDRPGACFDGLDELGEVVTCDVTDLDELIGACQDIDTIIHLAANPDPNAAWAELLGPNIIGTYNVFAASKAAGCRRVVFASSIHAVMGYPPDQQVATTDLVNPGDVYGVTKCFGEAMGRYMAEQEGVSVVVLRLGAFLPIDVAQDAAAATVADIYLAPEDLFQLLDRSVDAEGIRFGLFHAISNNRVTRLDLSDTRRVLGYQPVHDFALLPPQLAPSAQAQPPELQVSGRRREDADVAQAGPIHPA
jgi:uronate dehydrogenase